MRISDKSIICVLALAAGIYPAAAQNSAPLPPKNVSGGIAPYASAPLPSLAAPQVAAPVVRGAVPDSLKPGQPSAEPRSTAMPLVPFTSAREALRAWFRDKTAGDQAGAIRALEYAAGQGHLAAQFKLGRMYALGEGAPHNDLKAFEYYSRIADENADESPGTADGKLVASAFVSLGGYFMTGIKSTYVQPNASRAFDMFHYAASYFGDPEGQFSLARMYMEGIGTQKNDRQAARWLKLAAEKGHTGARAVFGDLLVRGADGVARQGAQGLMWLTLARDSVESDSDAWIVDLHERALASVSHLDREAAHLLLQRRLASAGQRR